MDCLILGDSIAVGVAQQRPECQAIATVGISSTAFVNRHARGRLEADQVVISLGSNDGHIEIAALLELRRSVRARRVYWIVPRTPAGEFAVKLVAASRGDRVFEFVPGPDQVHPRDYRELADRLR